MDEIGLFGSLVANTQAGFSGNVVTNAFFATRRLFSDVLKIPTSLLQTGLRRVWTKEWYCCVAFCFSPGNESASNGFIPSWEEKAAWINRDSFMILMHINSFVHHLSSEPSKRNRITARALFFRCCCWLQKASRTPVSSILKVCKYIIQINLYLYNENLKCESPCQQRAGSGQSGISLTKLYWQAAIFKSRFNFNYYRRRMV